MEISRQINRLIEKSLSNEINRERTTVTAIFISNPEEYNPQTNPRVRIAVRTAGTLNDGREASEYIATKIGVEILSSINRDVLDEVASTALPFDRSSSCVSDPVDGYMLMLVVVIHKDDTIYVPLPPFSF